MIVALLANPQWVTRLSVLAGPDHYYSTVLITLFLAFVAGNAAMLWVLAIQIVMVCSYQWIFDRLPFLRRWLLQRAQARYARQLEELQRQVPQSAPSSPETPQQQQPVEERPAAAKVTFTYAGVLQDF